MRIESLSTSLKDQQAEREKTIQKLKDATRYDSTLELLEKYGGGEARPKSKKKNTEEGGNEGNKKSPGKQQRPDTGMPNRTNMPPPATANIQHRNGHSHPGTPQPSEPGQFGIPQQRIPSPSADMAMGAEFSPNAFDGMRPPQIPGGQYEFASAGVQNRWYDRIMDLLLGEDETAPKNRIVLICKRCRLVNGQAPPGTNSLAELGTWKCMGCNATNGEVDEGKRILREVLGQQTSNNPSTDGENDNDSSDIVEAQSEDAPTEDDVKKEEEEENTSGVRKRRGKGKK